MTKGAKPAAIKWAWPKPPDRTKAKPLKVKEGQWVKVVSPMDDQRGLLGKIGRVLKVRQDLLHPLPYLIQFSGRTDLHTGGGLSESPDCWWHPRDALIVVAAPPPAKPKTKAKAAKDETPLMETLKLKPTPEPKRLRRGQMVIVGQRPFDKPSLRGCVGVVVKVSKDKDPLPYLVQFEGKTSLHNGGGFSDSKDCWWLSDDCVKALPGRAKLKGKAKATPKPKEEPKKKPLKVGQWVKVFKQPYDKPELRGEVGVIIKVNDTPNPMMPYLVQFKGRTDLHDGQKMSTADDCWWIEGDRLKVFPAGGRDTAIDKSKSDAFAKFGAREVEI